MNEFILSIALKLLSQQIDPATVKELLPTMPSEVEAELINAQHPEQMQADAEVTTVPPDIALESLPTQSDILQEAATEIPPEIPEVLEPDDTTLAVPSAQELAEKLPDIPSLEQPSQSSPDTDIQELEEIQDSENKADFAEILTDEQIAAERSAAEKQRIETEKERIEAEKKRLEQERQQAEAEKLKQLEAQAKAEQLRREEEERRRKEEEEKRLAEQQRAEALRKAEEERLAAEAKKRAEAEAKAKAEAEAAAAAERQKREEEARQKQEAERKLKEAEAQKQAALAAEAKAKAEAEAKLRAEEQQRRKAETAKTASRETVQPTATPAESKNTKATPKTTSETASKTANETANSGGLLNSIKGFFTSLVGKRETTDSKVEKPKTTKKTSTAQPTKPESEPLIVGKLLDWQLQNGKITERKIGDEIDTTYLKTEHNRKVINNQPENIRIVAPVKKQEQLTKHYNPVPEILQLPYRSKDNRHIPYFHDKSKNIELLFDAIRQGNSKVLISMAESINDLNQSNTAGELAINIAVTERNYEALDFLISRGVRINDVDVAFWTPLHYAVASRNVKAAYILLQMGADPNIQDRIGRTPLMYAVLNKDVKTIYYILSTHRVDFSLIDHAGNNLFSLLKQVNDPKCINLIRYYFAINSNRIMTH